MRRYAALALVAALAGSAACIDLSTDPDEIVAIEFRPLAWPAVVAGDTLRDSLGHVAPLEARLFDASGAEVDGAVQFFSRDTLTSVTESGLLVARTTADGTTQLLASGAGIQSAVRRVEVVPRPDSLAAEGTIDTLRWVIPDSPGENTSGLLRVKLFSRGSTPAKGVRSWIVSWSLSFQGQPIAPGDTSRLWLVSETGLASTLDTTDAQGVAARRVRLRVSSGLGLGALDSAVVLVEARERGVPVARSPVRLVLPIKPRG